MIRSIPAADLKSGMALALPFEKTARVVGEVKVGTKYVSFKTEHGTTRVGRYDEVLVFNGER